MSLCSGKGEDETMMLRLLPPHLISRQKPFVEWEGTASIGRRWERCWESSLVFGFGHPLEQNKYEETLSCKRNRMHETFAFRTCSSIVRLLSRDAALFSKCLSVRLSVRRPEPFVRSTFAVAVTPMMAPGSVRPDLRIACAALSEHRVARREVALRALKLRHRVNLSDSFFTPKSTL